MTYIYIHFIETPEFTIDILRPTRTQMNKTDFAKLLISVSNAGKIKRGEIKPSRVFHLRSQDVRAIRAALNRSQSEFALMIGVSIGTLQNWEQGRRRPTGPAQALLKVALVNPKLVERALGG